MTPNLPLGPGPNGAKLVVGLEKMAIEHSHWDLETKGMPAYQRQLIHMHVRTVPKTKNKGRGDRGREAGNVFNH